MKQVVVAVIRRPEDGKYLLVSSKKEWGEFTGYLYPPGGKIEDDETKEAALKRELREELSLDVEPLREIAETPGDVEQVTYWWECRVKPGQEMIISDELSEVGFFSREEMQERNLWPATETFFREYIDKPGTKRERNT